MVFVCIVLAVILVFVLVRHLHFVWQIKSINEQIEFINTHETNKIVTGEYRNGSITDLINNINALSRQCSILKTQCLTNESKEAAKLLGISLATLDEARNSGLISYIQYVPNGCVYFTSAYLQEYVAKCTYRAKPVEKKATYRNVRGNKSHL